MGIAVGTSGKLSMGGAPTALSAEPTTQVGATKTYQITNAAKRVLDPQTQAVVKVSGVAVASANIKSINAMAGEVTFVDSYTPAASPTFDGKYVPRAEVAQVRGFEGDPKLETADVTQVGSSNPSRYEQSLPTVMSWDGKAEVLGSLTDRGLQAYVTGRAPLLLELDPDGSGASVTRAWVLITQAADPVKAKDVEGVQMDFKLYDQSTAATALNGVVTNAAFDFATT